MARRNPFSVASVPSAATSTNPFLVDIQGTSQYETLDATGCEKLFQNNPFINDACSHRSDTDNSRTPLLKDSNPPSTV